MNFSKLFRLFFFLTILISCEPDQLIDTSGTESQSKSNDILDVTNERMGIASAEEIPGVIEILETLTTFRSKNSKSIKHKDTFIQTDKIKWIKSKKTELTNYTFPLVVRGQDEFEFYNLIIGVDSKGKEAQTFVRRYEVFEWAKEEYRASGYDFRKFRGKYYTYRLIDFYAEETVNKSSLSAISADCPNEDTIGSGSDNPDNNTQLVGIDQHQTWGTPNNTSPTGQVSFNSNSTNIVVYAVGSYVNNFQTGTYQYQETVSTESQGYVNVGDGTLSAPVLLSNPSGIVGMTITTNWTTTSSGGTSGQCLQRITVTIYYANGTSVSDPVFNGFCADSGPTQKDGSITAAGSTDCPQDDEVVISDALKFKVIQKGLCLPKESQAYEWIAANNEGTEDLYNFMVSKNVSSCSQNTTAREFAIVAAETLPTDLVLNYDLMQVVDPCKRLNYLLTQSEVSSAITTIQNPSTTNDSESGFYFMSDVNGNILDAQQVQGGFDHVNLPVGNNITNHLHGHTINGEQGFSGKDIRTLFLLYSRNSNTSRRIDDFTSMLVTNHGTYALGIQDLLAFSALITDKDRFKTLDNRALGVATRSKSNASKFMSGFLKMITEIKVEFKIGGTPLSLY